MSDAWEILVEHSTAGDAWERLNSLTGGTCVAGQPITELAFTLSGVSQITGTVLAPAVGSTIGATVVGGTIKSGSLTNVVSVSQITGTIEVEEI